MKAEELKNRIDKNIQKIQKKKNLISTRKTKVEKHYQELRKLGVNDPELHDRSEFYGCNNYDDIYWIYCSIDDLKEGIKNNYKDIEKLKKTIEKYNLQLDKEVKKDDSLNNEIPKIFKALLNEITNIWDKWDKDRQTKIKEAYKRLEYKEFYKIYNHSDYELMYMTDEKIHNNNVKNAKEVVLDLYNRVKSITGEITSYKDLILTQGSNGCPAINGVVEGKNGKARVESITAGGYNIQRLHIRVLVHKM